MFARTCVLTVACMTYATGVQAFISPPRPKDKNVACSPDGRLVAWIPDNTTKVHLQEVSTSKMVRTLEAGSDFCSVEFSPDSKWLAAATRKKVHIWDIASGKELHSWAPNTFGQHHSLRFSPDGKRLLLGARGISLWDVATAKEIWRIDGSQAAFAANGTIAAWGIHGGPIKLLDPAAGTVRVSLQPLKNPRRLAECEEGWWLDSTTFSKDAAYLAATNYSVVNIFHVEKQSLVHTYDAEERIYWIALSPDEKVLATQLREEIALWETATGKLLRRMPSTSRTFVFAPDGLSLFKVQDGKLRTLPLVESVAHRTMAQAWTDLSSAQAGTAWRALRYLAREAKATPFLDQQLTPVPLADARRIAKLAEDLDSNQYAVRVRASKELEALDLVAEPALRRALASNPSLETRQRIEKVLGVLDRFLAPGEALRQVRAVQALEYSGTPDSRAVLEKLAKGEPAARLTRDAVAALERLVQRPAKP